ncbi:unnamed protein product, partial [Amoebophrya sp. A25]
LLRNEYTYEDEGREDFRQSSSGVLDERETKSKRSRRAQSLWSEYLEMQSALQDDCGEHHFL